MKKSLILALLFTAASNASADEPTVGWGTRCYRWASNNPWKATAIGLGGVGIGLGGGYWYYTRPRRELKKWFLDALKTDCTMAMITDFDQKVSVGNPESFTRETPGMSPQLLDELLDLWDARVAKYNQGRTPQSPSVPETWAIEGLRRKYAKIKDLRERLYGPRA